MSLRTKLLSFAAALVLIPGAIYGAISLAGSRAALVQVVGRQLAAEAGNGADRLASALRAERQRLASLAGQDVMREIRIADLDKRISSMLASTVRGCAACAGMLVRDGSGHVVAATDPAWIARPDAALPLPPLEAGATIDGPIVMPQRQGEVVRLSVPVPDPDAPGRRLGQLVAFLDWPRATADVARVRENLAALGLDADALVVDAAGLVIGGAARPDGPWQLGSTLTGMARGNGDAHAVHVDTSAGMLVGRATLPADLPPWTVVVAESLADAFVPVRETRTRLMAMLAGTLMVALALALLAARRVTRPLAALTAVADAVGRGVRPAAVPVRSHDEIGSLTAAFNRMAADLDRAARGLAEASKFSFVGEVAAGVAHEIRTPLGVLRSSAQLLEQSLEPRDDDARELLRLLRDEVDRIDRVVSALLELGRPREMQPEPAALGPILAHAVEFVGAQARQKGIAIRLTRDGPDAVIPCDPELIYQVALNLLVNAVQILPMGGGVEVRLLPVRAGHAGFEVRDDGPGMTEAVRQRVFEPFFTARMDGTGLGLTFVQRVVQEHRGRVSVTSTPGRGTVFCVELPAEEAGT